MGSKIGARQLMDEAGVPIVPGRHRRRARRRRRPPGGRRDRLPGRGQGLRRRWRQGLPRRARPRRAGRRLRRARREGERFFADATVYLERYLPNPRHVEIQVLADAHGNSDLPRRARLLHPAPPPEAHRGDARARSSPTICAAHGRGVGARRRGGRLPSAGTLEYLVAGEEFFFLEMNTRIQVEHTVTEMVTGIDLVREQIRIAAGEPMSITQAEVRPRGHAFEVPRQRRGREPALPARPRADHAYREPAGPGVRVDSGVGPGSAIPDIYDPMIAKLIVWDVDRESRPPSDDPRPRRVPDRRADRPSSPSTAGSSSRRSSSPAGRATSSWRHERRADAASRERRTPDGAPSRRRGRPQVERAFVAEVDGRRFDVRLRYPEADVPWCGPAPSAEAKASATVAPPGAARRAATTSSARCRAPSSILVVARPDGRGGRDRLHRGGHEDGERGHGPQSRNRGRDRGRRGAGVQAGEALLRIAPEPAPT